MSVSLPSCFMAWRGAACRTRPTVNKRVQQGGAMSNERRKDRCDLSLAQDRYSRRNLNSNLQGPQTWRCHFLFAPRHVGNKFLISIFIEETQTQHLDFTAVPDTK